MKDELNFNEEVMLALYLEVFKEYYDKGEDKYNDNYNTTINEGRMQSVCYILQKLHLFDHEYGFSANWYIPYSAGVLALSNDIDRKEKSVNDFYDEYYNKRKEDNGMYNSLSRYYSEEQIHEVINITNILEEIKDDELGIELLSMLHFFINTKYGGFMENKAYYKEKIKESYPIYENKDELFEKAYTVLNSLGLTNKQSKEIPQRVKTKRI